MTPPTESASAVEAATELSYSDITSHRPSLLFIILGGFFIANALIAELIGVKIFALEPTLGMEPLDFNLFGEIGALQFSAGVLLWPVVFIMTDILNEYYGKRGIRLLSYLTMGLIVYAFVMIYLAIELVPADWWQTQYAVNGVPDMQAAFSSVFGQGMLIIVGSVFAFLLGQLIDVLVFHRIKQSTGEGKIWLRATGSTVVSQLVDTVVVLLIAFKLGPTLTGLAEPWPWSRLLAVITVQYTYKFIVAVLMTPVIYWMHGRIERFLGPNLAERMRLAATSWD